MPTKRRDPETDEPTAEEREAAEKAIREAEAEGDAGPYEQTEDWRDWSVIETDGAGAATSSPGRALIVRP